MSSSEPLDENPFKSPVAVGKDTSDEKKHRGRRVIVLVLSMLVIPPAVIIAFFTTCFAVGLASQSLAFGLLTGIAVGVAACYFLCRIANRYWNREV